MRHWLLVAAIAPLLLALPACGGKSSSHDTTSPVAATPQIPEAKSNVARTPEAAIDPASMAGAVTANNAFAFDLFARLASASPTDNVVVSPLSASMALTMAYAGATGETAAQMATALHFSGMTSSIFDGQNALSALLSWEAPDALGYAVQTASENGDPPPDPNDYQLQIVSSIWGEQSYTWVPAFLNTLAASYGSGVYEQDFIHQSDASRQTINTWVDAATSGAISNLLPQSAVDGDTRIVVADALHLRLPWKTAFDPSATANAPFTRADGSTVTVPFMNLQAWLPDASYYGATGSSSPSQLIYLPLSGGALQMVLAVPNESLAAYEADLASGQTALGTPYNQELISLSLPKLSFTSASGSLKSTLQAMGMTDAFAATADFSGACPHTPDGGHILLSDVVQKTTLTLEENGIEAATSTAILTPDGGSQQPVGDLPTPVVLNQPFFFAVLDTSTGAVLLVGQVEDPSSTGSP